MDKIAAKAAKTAPGELELVHAFLNTWDMAGPRERFDSPERMQSWLAKRSLIGPAATLTKGDFEVVLKLRDGLRRVLGATSHEQSADRKSVWDLNHVAETFPLIVNFDQQGMPGLLPTGSGVTAALGRILAIIATSALDGTWHRLKICRNSDCQRTFFDSSKNKSAVWCTTQGCGNKLNARAYRARL
ncbi:CGNR zinc finger domain-containing protein [Bradyrhizobium sp. GCM10027634]|uniref:CGNR zinc finger domain-containing protein n=1 Tax=unclassified Bradyrhizobium TaxID=2631580 RepID=UPI00263AD571|nr:CGNR zinc finger domain-containing protein [Bradyrhizobium sp. WYCCWR 12677]MDN5005480.1 CGNR zinc finger domain-containing protein [Bradyrhizobium sp. WYCCWR 12677]